MNIAGQLGHGNVFINSVCCARSFEHTIRIGAEEISHWTLIFLVVELLNMLFQCASRDRLYVRSSTILASVPRSGTEVEMDISERFFLFGCSWGLGQTNRRNWWRGWGTWGRGWCGRGCWGHCLRWSFFRNLHFETEKMMLVVSLSFSPVFRNLSPKCRFRLSLELSPGISPKTELSSWAPNFHEFWAFCHHHWKARVRWSWISSYRTIVIKS